MDSKKNNNSKKISKSLLTDLSAAVNLKIAPESPQADRRVFKQSKGGKVDTTQPPHVSGFILPVNPSGDDTSLSGGYGIKNRSRGNTCGATFGAFEDSRQFCDCHNFKKTKDKPAMNANTHGTATPVAATPGVSSDQCNDCLLPSSVLSDAIQHAKQEAASRGKFGTSDAYAKLLKHFHAAILPAFIAETGGNMSAMARLLGVHRSSVRLYAHDIGLTDLDGRKGQEVQS